MKQIALFSSLFLLSSLAIAQDNNRADWVTKDQSAIIAGKKIEYTSTCGMMPMRDRDGAIEGRIFFTYYKAKGSENRPVTFVWNGGPGSASIWLHLGSAGPKRVKMAPGGLTPEPPYQLVPNDESILPTTDIVMVDPIGTGFSRPDKPALGPKFWGVQEDIGSVGEFVRSFINENDLWKKKIYLYGESYGTFRAAGVSNWLTDNGIGVSGIVMLSTLTNYGTVSPEKSNPLPIALNLPTMACTAWYHKKLSPTMQKLPVSEVADQARDFMYKTLMPGLIKGTAMTPKERDEVVNGMVKFTGLDKTFVDGADGKISLSAFWAGLLRDDRQLVGRLDGRFTGYARNGIATGPDFDPSNSGITPVFTSTWNDYVRNELGYKTNLKYYVLGEGLNSPWNFGNGNADTSEALRRAMTKNPFMQVMYCCGYYDFATPFAATEFGVNQMELDRRLLGNISYKFYESGHMVYLEEKSRVKFGKDLLAFLK